MGLQIESVSLDPTAGDLAGAIDGDIWYNTATSKLRGKENGQNQDLVNPSGLLSNFGEYYISNLATTIINAVSTPVKIAGTTTAGELDNFTHVPDNRLVYNGASTYTFQVVASLSLVSIGNNRVAGVYIAKNGIVEPKTLQRSNLGVLVTPLTVSGLISLSTNDFIEIFIENQTDAINLTVTNMNVNVR